MPIGFTQENDVEIVWETEFPGRDGRMAIQLLVASNMRTDGLFLQARKIVMRDGSEPYATSHINVRDIEVESFRDAVNEACELVVRDRASRGYTHRKR
jgi:hypothetical protein